MNAMILAAGLGTRLQPFTNLTPKPAIPFLNIPMAWYSLFNLCQVKINRLVINTHHLPQGIQKLFTNPNAFSKLPHRPKEIIFSHEDPIILGSGGGIKKAQPFLEDSANFLLINGDTLFFPTDTFFIENLIHEHQRKNALATLVVMAYPGVGTQFGGVWANPEGKVVSIGKTSPPNSGKLTAWHFTGIQILSKRIFERLPDTDVSHIFTDALIPSLNTDDVYTYIHQAPWYETGNLQDYLTATSDVLRKLLTTNNDETLYKIVKCFSPSFGTQSTLNEGFNCSHHLNYLNDLFFLGDNCHLSPDLQIKGFLVCGHNVTIEKNCYIENVVIASNQKIKAGSHLTNTLIL